MRVKIDGDWESAMGKALRAKPPEGGWPKPEPVPQRAKKSKTVKKAKRKK